MRAKLQVKIGQNLRQGANRGGGKANFVMAKAPLCRTSY
jgi:hypothetical protein